MKVFFVGDFVTDTGAGMANKLLIKGLENENILYSKASNKVTRVFELIYKMLISDSVCFCNYSNVTFIGIKFANILNMKSYYLLHGYLTYEKKINYPSISEDELNKINFKEKKIFKNVHKIICVSKIFMEFMKEEEPDYQNKFDYIYNPVDIEKIKKISGNYSKQKNNKQIVSIGGGRKQKNIINICKAIDKLNREQKMDLRLIVIGLPLADKKKIISYNFVTYYDSLPHEEVIKILLESYIYIQNSDLETFGIAIIEALYCNCNLLISKNVGAIGVLETIEDRDLINDTQDIKEISDKIKAVISNNNADRLKKGLAVEKIQINNAGMSLLNKF